MIKPNHARRARKFTRTLGVYRLIHRRKVVYVGQSECCECRIHAQAAKKVFTEFAIISCTDLESANALEFELIREYLPKYNVAGVSRHYSKPNRFKRLPRSEQVAFHRRERSVAE